LIMTQNARHASAAVALNDLMAGDVVSVVRVAEQITALRITVDAHAAWAGGDAG